MILEFCTHYGSGIGAVPRSKRSPSKVGGPASESIPDIRDQSAEITQVVAGDVEHDPTRTVERAQSMTISGQLITVRVPLAVVLDAESQDWPREVKTRDEVPIGIAHNELRHTRWQPANRQRHAHSRLGRRLGAWVGKPQRRRGSLSTAIRHVRSTVGFQIGARQSPSPSESVYPLDRDEQRRRSRDLPRRVRRGTHRKVAIFANACPSNRRDVDTQTFHWPERSR